MSLRRVSGLAMVAVSILLWMACGDYYRPVVFPYNIIQTNPANFHTVFSINSNGYYTANPPVSSSTPPGPQFNYDVGSAMQIDVSGDTILAETGGLGARDGHLNINPTAAVMLPNASRVFVSSAGSILTGGEDVVSSFTPIIQGLTISLGTVNTAALPNLIGNAQISTITSISETGSTVTVTLAVPVTTLNTGAVVVISGVSVAGYNGTFTITGISGSTITYTDSVTGLAPVTGSGTASAYPGFCRYLPDAVAAAQNNSVYVANYGEENGANCNLSSTDSIAVVNATNFAITNLIYTPAGSHPIAMVEANNINTDKLYTINAGNNTISSYNPVDFSQNTLVGYTGLNASWMVPSADAQKLYIVTQGDGNLVTLDTVNDTVSGVLPVGAGANYVGYEPNHNRLYVTNPMNSSIYIFSTNGGTDSATGLPDNPSLMSTINLAPVTGNYPSCLHPCPVSVAALPDGTRAYVGSYTLSGCADPTFSPTCIVTPEVIIIDTQSNTIETRMSPMMSGSGPVAESIDCVPQGTDSSGLVIPYTPAALPIPGLTGSRYTTRFRLSTAASPDSTHAYVGVCDAGVVADIMSIPNPLSQGNEQPDTLVTDLATPFGVGYSPSSTTLPRYQSPILLLPGQ